MLEPLKRSVWFRRAPRDREGAAGRQEEFSVRWGRQKEQSRRLGMIRQHAVALMLCGVSLLAACENTASGTDQDAADVVDGQEANDLSSDIVDAADDAGDAGNGVDHPDVVARDVPDAPDAGADVRSPWGDAPLVDVGGGILIPVDPNAVPAPGSECTGDGGVREGDPSIAPPRPVRPYSVSRVTSQRPSFQWILPEGTTGARLEVCADRCCTRVLQTVDAEGSTVRLTTSLPPGVVYWRLFGRRGTTIGSRASYTWEFGVRRRDAPNDTSWGTLRDFTGDGYDDLVILQPIRPFEDPARLLLFEGSSAELRAPRDTGIVADGVPTRVGIGDVNGDGLADVAWSRDPFDSPNACVLVVGSRGPLRASEHVTSTGFPTCGRFTVVEVVDWNGDGYSDLIAQLLFYCDPSVTPLPRVLAVYLGSSSGPATIPQRVFRLDSYFENRSFNLSGSISDIDNDGYGDVVVGVFATPRGAPPPSLPPEQFVLYGGLGAVPRVERLPRPASVDEDTWHQAHIGAVGDYDGDHVLDFALRATDDSRLHVYLSASDLSLAPVVLTDPLRGGEFGFFFGVGDVDGDGLSDALVASRLAAPDSSQPLSNRGRAYVFRGGETGLGAVPFWTERNSADAIRAGLGLFGGLLSSPGDLNGDGVDDMIMRDGLDSRLCTRFGRLDLRSGNPDACFGDSLDSESRSF